MVNRSSIIFIFLIGSVWLLLFACKGNNSKNKKSSFLPDTTSSYPISSNLGLQVNTQGVLVRHGKPYRGIGVDYWTVFTRSLSRIKRKVSYIPYKKGFCILKEYHIPFIQFTISGYWPDKWQLYQDDKQKYFSKLDDVVHAAKQNGIGLILSFFGHGSTIPDLVGEPVGQWGSPGSKTIAFMKKYTKQVVKRYVHSPAIWGWAFDSEMNLRVDTPSFSWPIDASKGTPPTRNDSDKVSTHDMIVAMQQFAKTVRKYDASRIIISGNGIPRSAAYHRYYNNSAVEDTKSQYKQMLRIQNPDPVNTISIHLYPHYVAENTVFSDTTASVKGLIKASMRAAQVNNKPLFIGGFGVKKQNDVTPDHAKFYNLLDAIETYKVPLAAVWVFNYPARTQWNILPTNSRSYQLKVIGKLNERLP